jgi:hypothetical protein
MIVGAVVAASRCHSFLKEFRHLYSAKFLENLLIPVYPLYPCLNFL